MADAAAKAAKVEGLERLRAKLLKMTGPQAQAAMLKANTRSASEFEALVRQIVPQGDEERGHLVDTLRQTSRGATGVEVSIGDKGNPYPAHLELGHKARDGSHVPGLAFWFPAKRVTKKKAHGRIVRAERAAIKQIMGGANG